MRYKNHTTEKTQSNTYRIYNADGIHVGTIQETKNYKNHPGLQRYTAKGTKNNPEYANRTAYGKNVTDALHVFIEGTTFFEVFRTHTAGVVGKSRVSIIKSPISRWLVILEVSLNLTNI